MARELAYWEALSEGMVQSMERDKSIFITGIAVDYPSGLFGTTSEALKQFGPDRVFDSPAMENALTGIAIGAASLGKRPVIVHPRNDFLLLAFDQLINLAAKWKYMFGGNAGTVPIVVRAVIGKGWGQGATHSQSFHSVLGHFPGLNVTAPSCPAEAKAVTISALTAEVPTVILEHRALYNETGEVSEAFKASKVGAAKVVRQGTDVTIVACSLMVKEALTAADELEKKGVSVEVVDPCWIRPLDTETISKSIKKTGRLVVSDISWELYGFTGEIAALAAERCLKYLKAPVKRVALADCPAPVSNSLETAFYPKASTLVKATLSTMGMSDSKDYGHIDPEDTFKGPY